MRRGDAGDDRLIVLERVSATAKLYLARLDASRALVPRWSDPTISPAIEELSADDALARSVLHKELLFSADDHPWIGLDLEGRTLLDERTILLVNDNDFGVESAPTRLWRVELATPLRQA